MSHMLVHASFLAATRVNTVYTEARFYCSRFDTINGVHHTDLKLCRWHNKPLHFTTPPQHTTTYIIYTPLKQLQM